MIIYYGKNRFSHDMAHTSYFKTHYSQILWKSLTSVPVLNIFGCMNWYLWFTIKKYNSGVYFALPRKVKIQIFTSIQKFANIKACQGKQLVWLIWLDIYRQHSVPSIYCWINSKPVTHIPSKPVTHISILILRKQTIYVLIYRKVNPISTF